MTYRTILLALFLSMGIFSASLAQNSKCKEGLNLLPMYGGVKKCKEQVKVDQDYLAMVAKHEPNARKASLQMVDSAISYLNNKQYDEGMKRVNQAWLIDKTNPHVYIAFTLVLDLQGKTEEAKAMMDRTLKMIKKRENSATPTVQEPSNDILIDTLVGNTVMAYETTANDELTRHLYAQVDAMNVSDDNKTIVRYTLDRDVLKKEAKE